MSGEEPLFDWLRRRGGPFDSLVDAVADAFESVGYPSRHSSAARKLPVDPSSFKRRVNRLGLLCLEIENAIRASAPPGEDSTEGLDRLAIYASASKLLVLLREAQRSGQLTGRAAVELDGEIDELEECVNRVGEWDGLVRACRWVTETVRRFADKLPEAIQAGGEELALLL